MFAMMTMEKKLNDLLDAWMKVAWSNKEIMLCLDIGTTQASKIHQDAKLHKGLFRSKSMKTKVKADVVCEIMGIDRKAEIKRIIDCLTLLNKQGGEENGDRRII